MASPEYQRLSCLRNIAFTVSCFLLLAGCAAKRDNYNVPALDLPGQYAKAPLAADIANPGNASTYTPASSFPLDAALAEWWRLLGSQELNELMDRALANNPDLRIAVLRIAQSKARLDQAGADKAPAITMPAQIKNEYPESGVGRGNASGKNKSRTTHQISIRGDWRPDIWGESYSLYESAELQLLRATYQRDDMQRNVVANVVASYMEYLSLNDRLRVARETEKSLGEMLASVNARLEAGDTTITEMEQQKAAVYSVKATIPVLEQQREVVLNRLASLAGSAPVALKLSDSGLDSAKFPPVLPGVPSALLLRRSDVRAAEARLLAADADIDVARARVLPPLDLTTQVGYGSIYMSGLFAPQSLFWSVIANLSATIFDSGKRAKEVEFSEAMHEELVETYVRVVYDAVREVDDSLSAIGFMGKRLEAQGVAADSSLRAWNFSQEAFMAGAVDYLVVLDTQRTYQRNLDDWYNVRLDRYRGLVNLFGALGGGVPSGDAMPGKGTRPVPLKSVASKTDRAAGEVDAALPGNDSKVGGDIAKGGENSGSFLKDILGAMFTAILPGSARPEEAEVGVDWAGNSLRNGTNHWLAELSGVYDRGAVLPAWRDLRARFPRQVESRILLPQRQGQVDVAGKERASWYRLFVGTFTSKKMAEEFCATLRAGQQRCGAASSHSLAGKGDFVAPSDQSNMVRDKDGQQNQAQGGQVIGAETAPVKAAQEAQAQAEQQAAPEAAQPEIRQPATEQPETKQLTEIVAAQLLASSPETLIELWVKDWSEKNVEGYLSRYDIGFEPGDGGDRDAWEAKRRRRISEAATIRVRAENLKIERHTELIATARFAETIEVGSYKKTSRKKLLLARRDRDSEWKIWEEKEETQAQAQAEADAPAAAEAKAAKLKAKREAEAEAARLKAERQAHTKAEKLVAEKNKQEAKAEAALVKAGQKTKTALVATQQDKELFDGVDWSGQQFWLVEMSDAHDRNAVTAAWRELRARFPDQMKNLTIHPRRQSRMDDTAGDHAIRYQLFIAKFPEKQMAEEFCAMLRAGQQRCGVVSSQSFAGKDDLNLD